MKTLMGVEAAAGKTPSLTGEFVGETHRFLEHTQTYPLRKQHQRVLLPNLNVGSRGSD